MLGALATMAYRRSRWVIAVTGAVAVFAAAFGGSVVERLDPYGAEDPATDSARADERLERSGVEPAVALAGVVRTRSGVDSEAGGRRIERVVRVLASDPAVGRVTSHRDAGPALVSRDGRSSYVTAHFKPGTDDGDDQDAAQRLVDRLSGEPGVVLGGPAVADLQANEQISEDLVRAELVAFPLLFLLSLLFFRGVVAALLPVVVGGLAIVLTLFGLRIVSEVTSISVFALNLVTALGLGLAIDYSLFVVSRYREEIAAVGPGLHAIQRTLSTAGRTVVFSAFTVAAALAALLVFPQRFLYSMGIGGVMVALVACAVTLVVLPAMLAVLGPRVDALAPKRFRRAAEREARPMAFGFWYRLSRMVMRRPARIAIAAAAVMIALGVPFTQAKFTFADASVLPIDASSRQVADLLERDFSTSRANPIYLAIDEPPGRRVDVLAKKLVALPGVAGVSEPGRVTATTSVLNVYSASAPLSAKSEKLVREIRAMEAPFEFFVGGWTAMFSVDLQDSIAAHLPDALAVVAIATIVILFLMTGSIVLPIKALVMNALTISATFGLLVLIFQDGRLEGVLGYSSQGALEMTGPVVLFALAFGLSTDYGVFLLSRIKEARDLGAANRDAVAVGLERTGRIVTAAALLLCVAIGAIATSEIIFIKALGVGTALAVLIDATIVRALLVPSLMELLGHRNWWAPRLLKRLHQRMGLSEVDAGPGGPSTAAGAAESKASLPRS